MSGQPQIPGRETFDVTNLIVLSESSPDLPEIYNNSNIIDKDETFTLKVVFEGGGQQWPNIACGHGMRARVTVHAEGVGGLADPELDMKPVVMPLSNKNVYEVPVEVEGGIPTNGVFRLGAMVTLERLSNIMDDITDPSVPADPYFGWLGFYEGLLIQVHEQEEA